MQEECGRGNVHIRFWWGNLKEDTGVDGRILLKWIFETWAGGTNWVDQAQDSDRW